MQPFVSDLSQWRRVTRVINALTNRSHQFMNFPSITMKADATHSLLDIFIASPSLARHSASQWHIIHILNVYSCLKSICTFLHLFVSSFLGKIYSTSYLINKIFPVIMNNFRLRLNVVFAVVCNSCRMISLQRLHIITK